ncbi:MAG: hypothetical protein NTY96_12360 [Bacteroidetes bacterium]|nr:hypothetical protein [Bacteroidota bacterium]
MQKALIILGFCLYLILLGSCKKKDDSSGDNSIDHVPILSYLPVYPNSYWKYVRGIDTTLSKTSDTYITFMGLNLSTLDDWPVNQYKQWFDFGMYNSGWYSILSETVGATWEINLGDMRFNPYTQAFKVIRKTVDRHGDSIIIQRYYVYHKNPPLTNSAYIWQTFKKNVGLVFECKVDTSNNDTIYKKVLIDYHINH